MRATLLLLLAGCTLQGPFLGGETLDSADASWGDADGDGYVGDDDCGPTEFDVNPGAPERCDGVDNDCDEATDEDDAIDPTDWYADSDGDGFGDALVATSCEDPVGAVAVAGDCDDADAQINPEVAEVCGDGKDNDCDGSAGCPWDGQYDAEDVQHAAILGDELEGYGGKEVLLPGDMDGDGDAELVTSAPAINASYDVLDNGMVFVYQGPLVSGEREMSEAEASWLGPSEWDMVGYGIAGLGDLSGEGVVGLGVGSGSNEAYFLFFDLRDALLTGAEMSPDQELLPPTYGQHLGATALGGFDIDGDGSPDLALGARFYEEGPTSVDGGVHLYSLGDAGSFEAGAVLSAEAYDKEKNPGLGAGDLDGDGVDELLVGAPMLAEDGGEAHGGVFVVSAGDLGGTLLDDSPSLLAPYEACYGGVSVAAPDANADGYADLLFGGPTCSLRGPYDGAAWLAWGGRAALDEGGLSLAFEIAGQESAAVGNAVASGGDMDGDGDDEVLVGASSWSELGIYGAFSLWYEIEEGSFALQDADAVFKASGADEKLGWSVAGGEDMTGDGLADLVSGGPGARGSYGLLRVIPGLSF